MQSKDPENYNYNSKKSDYEINKAIIQNGLDVIYNFIMGAYDTDQLNELIGLGNHSHSILSYDSRSGDYWDISLTHNKLSEYDNDISCRVDRLLVNDKKGYTLCSRSLCFNNQFPVITEKCINKKGDYPIKETYMLDSPKEINSVFNNILEPKVNPSGYRGIDSAIKIVPFDDAEVIRARNCKFVMREYNASCNCPKNHNKSQLQKLTDFIFRH